MLISTMQRLLNLPQRRLDLFVVLLKCFGICAITVPLGSLLLLSPPGGGIL